MFPPIAVPFRRQVCTAPERNSLCVATSPPPGGPGPAAGVPERLYALFPPAVVAGDGAADPIQPPPRRWRVPSVPVLGALIAVVLMSGVVVAVDQSHSAGAVAVAAPAGGVPATMPFEDLPVPPTTATTRPTIAAAPAPRTRPVPPPVNETAASPIVKVGEIRIPKI